MSPLQSTQGNPGRSLQAALRPGSLAAAWRRHHPASRTFRVTSHPLPLLCCLPCTFLCSQLGQRQFSDAARFHTAGSSSISAQAGCQEQGRQPVRHRPTDRAEGSQGPAVPHGPQRLHGRHLRAFQRQKVALVVLLVSSVRVTLEK